MVGIGAASPLRAVYCWFRRMSITDSDMPIGAAAGLSWPLPEGLDDEGRAGHGRVRRTGSSNARTDREQRRYQRLKGHAKTPPRRHHRRPQLQGPSWPRPIPRAHASPHDLLEVLDDRYARRGTLLASQVPVEHWHDVVGDPTFGDAILDRLLNICCGSNYGAESPDRLLGHDKSLYLRTIIF